MLKTIISLTLLAYVVIADDKVIRSFYSQVAPWTWGVSLFVVIILCMYSCYSCHWYRIKQIEAEMLSGEKWSDDLFNAMHKCKPSMEILKSLSKSEPFGKGSKSSRKSDFQVTRLSRHLSSGSSVGFDFPLPSPRTSPSHVRPILKKVSQHGVSPVGVPIVAEYSLSNLAKLSGPSIAYVSKEVLSPKRRDSSIAGDIIITRKQSFSQMSLSSSLVKRQVDPVDFEDKTV